MSMYNNISVADYGWEVTDQVFYNITLTNQVYVDQRGLAYCIVVGAIMSGLVVVAVGGNLLVVVALLTSPAFRTTNLLVLWLAGRR